jgi:phosphatidylserine synthase
LSNAIRTTLAGMTSTQKTVSGAPAYSRFVNRRLGRYLAATLHTLHLTPNAVTALSASVTGLGIVGIALLRPSVLSAILVPLLLVIGYALDSADGQIARLRGGGTLAGEWLDHIVDAIKVSLLHLAVFISFLRFLPQNILLDAVPLAYEAIAAVLFFAMILTEQLRRRAPDRPAPSTRTSSPLYSIAVAPTDYGLLCLVFAFIWWPPAFVTLYGLLMIANLLFLLLALRKWFKELSTL